MKIKRFEDPEIWKESRMLVGNIYKLTSKPKLKSDFGLKDQLQRHQY